MGRRLFLNLGEKKGEKKAFPISHGRRIVASRIQTGLSPLLARLGSFPDVPGAELAKKPPLNVGNGVGGLR